MFLYNILQNRSTSHYEWKDHPKRLPQEILLQIFSLLCENDRLACRAVCREWLQIADEPIFLQNIAQKRFHSDKHSALEKISTMKELVHYVKQMRDNRYFQYHQLNYSYFKGKLCPINRPPHYFSFEKEGVKYLGLCSPQCGANLKVQLINTNQNIMEFERDIPDALSFSVLKEGRVFSFDQKTGCISIVDFRDPENVIKEEIPTTAQTVSLVRHSEEQFVFKSLKSQNGLFTTVIFVWDARRHNFIFSYEDENQLTDYFPLSAEKALLLFQDKISIYNILEQREEHQTALANIDECTFIDNQLWIETLNQDGLASTYLYDIGTNELKLIQEPLSQRQFFKDLAVSYTDEVIGLTRTPFLRTELKVLDFSRPIGDQPYIVVHFPFDQVPEEGPSSKRSIDSLHRYHLNTIKAIGEHQILLSLTPVEGGETHYVIWDYQTNKYQFTNREIAKERSKECDELQTLGDERDYTISNQEVAHLFEEMAKDLLESNRSPKQTIPFEALSEGWKSFIYKEMASIEIREKKKNSTKLETLSLRAKQKLTPEKHSLQKGKKAFDAFDANPTLKAEALQRAAKILRAAVEPKTQL